MRLPRCWIIPRRGYLVWPVLLILLLVGVVLMALMPSAEEHQGGDFARLLRRQMPQEHHDPVKSTKKHSSEEDARFTIVMQTYNRTDVLLKLLNHYQAMPRLQKIVIVWNNVAEPTPLKLWDSLGPHPVPLVFKQQNVNLMRNRLQPFHEIDTDAVLMLDDDTLVSVPDVSFAFSVWKQFPDQIVGFVPRKHVSTENGAYSYGSFELQNPENSGGDRATAERHRDTTVQPAGLLPADAAGWNHRRQQGREHRQHLVQPYSSGSESGGHPGRQERLLHRHERRGHALQFGDVHTRMQVQGVGFPELLRDLLVHCVPAAGVGPRLVLGPHKRRAGHEGQPGEEDQAFVALCTPAH